MKQRRTSHRRNAAVQPRWGWSGVAEIAEPQRVDEILMSVASSLPSHRSPLKQIAEELLALGARYHRYLHQDEFGPSRAQRMAALRVLLDYLDLLLSRLFSLPEHLRLCLSAAFALYSPSQSSSYCHDATVEQLYEVTVDVERALIRINAVDDAELMVQIRDVAQSTFEFLSSLDSTTDAEVFMEAALSIDLIGGDASSAGSFSNVCARLERLRRLFLVITMSGCSRVTLPRWWSPILPIMCTLTVMRWGAAGCAIGSSGWPRARCPRQLSLGSS